MDVVPLTPTVVDCVTFDRAPLGRRGYNEDQVDDFLDRVQATLAGNDNLTAQNVRDVVFDPAAFIRRGYNEDQVDEFLDLVVEELDRRSGITRQAPVPFTSVAPTHLRQTPPPGSVEQTAPMLFSLPPSTPSPGTQPLRREEKAASGPPRSSVPAPTDSSAPSEPVVHSPTVPDSSEGPANGKHIPEEPTDIEAVVEPEDKTGTTAQPPATPETSSAEATTQLAALTTPDAPESQSPTVPTAEPVAESPTPSTADSSATAEIPSTQDGLAATQPSAATASADGSASPTPQPSATTTSADGSASPTTTTSTNRSASPTPQPSATTTSADGSASPTPQPSATTTSADRSASPITQPPATTTSADDAGPATQASASSRAREFETEAWRDSDHLALPIPPAPPGERGYRPGDVERLMKLLATTLADPGSPAPGELANLKLSRTFFVGQGYHTGAVDTLRQAWLDELTRRAL